MNPQLSQDYTVDSRYRGMSRAEDNLAGKNFVAAFIKRRGLEDAPMGPESSQEDRFFMAGPGEAQYTFRNGFVASK